MNQTDLLLLAGLGGAIYFFGFTDEGKDIIDDLIGGLDIGKIPAIELEPGYSSEDIQDLIKDNAGYHFPIQDLYIPPDYYDVKYETDNRKPSPEFWDWYRKGSGLIFKDYYFPPHYTWNPDYYFYFGNMYKKWYPSAYEPFRYPGDRGFEPIPQTAWDFPLFP
jgi:hypothetical protein